MIYPSDFESKIGFLHVRDLISEKCISSMGKNEVSNMFFTSEEDAIISRLECVKEMMFILKQDLPIPIDNIHDILPYLNEIKVIGSYINSNQLYKIMTTLKMMSDLTLFFKKQKETESNSTPFPYLDKEFSNLQVFPDIINIIDQAINKFGEVKDSASRKLYETRQQIRTASGSVQKTIKRIIEKAVSQGLVEKDTAASLRDGRMVIPLPSSYKRSIPGIVHDESATGKTVYIEPTEVVEASNKVRELEMEERREIISILKEIADNIRPYAEQIISSTLMLGKIDFIRAKALFAIDLDAQLPNISSQPELQWYHATHPILELSLRSQNRSIVPLNINFTGDQRILIISGPNAGGKSICLKTVAIVQYMFQCGVMPTLYSNSHMGIFKNMFIDIGDEQSLENDLSTYSSHLKNMKYFVTHADNKTIFLADEMGTGTEPQIGGAIAQAILETLGKNKCMGIVTTHYQNLKKFANETEGFINGAMLYDRQHLQPTFELSIGNAGSSFALDIATKIGLPKSVIDEAKELVGNEYINIDKYLSEISRDRRYWANKRLNIKDKELRLEKLLSKYEETAEDLNAKRKSIINDAKKEAKEILDNVNSRIERTILEIRRVEAEKNATRKLRKNIEDLKNEISKSEDTSAEDSSIIKQIKYRKKQTKIKQESNKESNSNKTFSIGDYVILKEGGNTPGKILSINGKKAEVAFGLLRTTVNLDKLSFSSKPAQSGIDSKNTLSISTDNDSRKRQLNFKNEIDVRGMRSDEAIQAVTYFLDDAIQFNVGRVRVLHGTGHGILKTLIRQQLQSNTAVKSFGDEDVRFGGAGITVIDLE